MKERTRGSYVIAGREVVAEGADLRVTILTLASGQCIPWHSHSETADSFFCMEGPMVVEAHAPAASFVLNPGERCTVGPKRPHYVHGQNNEPCKFMIVQGVGVYDWVPEGEDGRG
jgi:mannose-6-phosphate isomerase-like protein (cupin superfamily)